MLMKDLFETVWLGILLHDVNPNSSDMETVSTMFENLQDHIASGVRKKFACVSRTLLNTWLLDQVKSSEFLKESKLVIDIHAKDLGLSENEVSSLLEMFLIKLINDKLESKPTSYSMTENEERDVANNVNANKGKPKDKPTGKSKIVHIDDEPPTGPELYIVLHGFHSFTFIETLFQSKILPLRCITLLNNFPTLTAATVDLSDRLKTKFKPYLFETNCIFTTLSCASLTTASLLFDALAQHWYELVQAKQEYHVFSDGLSVCKIPSLGGLAHPSFASEDSTEVERWLEKLIHTVCSSKHYQPSFPFGDQEICLRENEFNPAISRVESIITKLQKASTPFPERNLLLISKALQCESFFAEYCLDMYQLEYMTKKCLDSFVWQEQIPRDELIQRLETALSYSPLKSTCIQTRGSKVFIVLNLIEKTSNSDWRISIPKKKSFGEWFDSRMMASSAPLPSTSTSLPFCYDFSGEDLCGSHTIHVDDTHYIIENFKQLDKFVYLKVFHPQMSFYIYPDHFVASVPLDESKLFLNKIPTCLLPLDPLSSTTNFTPKRRTVYLSCNGWLCFRAQKNTLKSNQDNTCIGISELTDETSNNRNRQQKCSDIEDGLYIVSNLTDIHSRTTNQKIGKVSTSSFENVRWREIYSNGDQWVQIGQSIHFYGHDGKRGYTSISSDTEKSSWTWITPSGQVWTQGQPTSQLRTSKYVHPQTGDVQFWREDQLDSFETQHTKTVEFPDGTILSHKRTLGSIEMFIPELGNISLQDGRYHLRDLNGAEVVFSNEDILFTTPSGFSINVNEEQSEIQFEGCKIKANTMSVEKTKIESSPMFEPTIDSISSMNPSFSPTSFTSCSYLQNTIPMFMLDDEKGFQFYTFDAFQAYKHSWTQRRACMIETTELSRPCFIFDATHKAIQFPPFTSFFRTTISSHLNQFKDLLSPILLTPTASSKSPYQKKATHVINLKPKTLPFLVSSSNANRTITQKHIRKEEKDKEIEQKDVKPSCLVPREQDVVENEPRSTLNFTVSSTPTTFPTCSMRKKKPTLKTRSNSSTIVPFDAFSTSLSHNNPTRLISYSKRIHEEWRCMQQTVLNDMPNPLIKNSFTFTPISSDISNKVYRFEAVLKKPVSTGRGKNMKEIHPGISQ